MTTPVRDEQAQKALARVTRQLQEAKQAITRDPHLNGQWGILETTFNLLEFEAAWKSSGEASPLLMALAIGLTGHTTATSTMGFVGKALDATQKGALKLMQASMVYPDIGKVDLLKNTNQIVTLATFYLLTQVAGNTKAFFPQGDVKEAERGAALYQELGFIFLFEARIIERLFRMVAQTMGLSEREQKAIGNIGVFQLILMLTAGLDEQPDLQERLLKYLKSTIPSVDKAIQLAQSQGIIEEALGNTALSQLQLLHLITDGEDIEAFKETLASSFSLLGVSYTEFKQDIKDLEAYCSRLRESLNNTFNQKEQRLTTLTQAA